MLRSAESLIAQHAADQQAQRKIEEAVASLEKDPDASIEAAEEQVRRLERQAEEMGHGAYAHAARGGVADSWPPERGAQELLEQADHGLEEAARLVEGGEGSDLHGRAQAVLERLQGFRARLSTQVETRR